MISDTFSLMLHHDNDKVNIQDWSVARNNIMNSQITAHCSICIEYLLTHGDLNKMANILQAIF